jgi:Ion channel
MFERPMISISGFDFNNLYNCVWCIIITVATVGYGDYFPISNCGRMVGILACLWGTFVVSIFVVTLNNLLEFSM